MKQKYLSTVLLISVIIALALFAYLVMAAVSLQNPVRGGNYSVAFPMPINCTGATITTVLNATVYYNATGGRIAIDEGGSVLISGRNTSIGEYSINTSATANANFTTPFDALATGVYNFTCVFYNGSLTNKGNETTGSASNITIDNNGPNITFMWAMPAAGSAGLIGNMTVQRTGVVGNVAAVAGTLKINATVNDTVKETANIGLDQVYFNLSQINDTRSVASFGIGQWLQTALVRATLNKTNANPVANETFANYTLATTSYPSGRYNIFIYANDTLANVNHTEYMNVTIDSNAPNISAALIKVTGAAAASSIWGVGTGANVSNSIVINLSTNDTIMDPGLWTANLDQVHINLTTATGNQKNFNRTDKNTSYYATPSNAMKTVVNFTLDTTSYTDGKYILKIWANDTGGNLNNTEYINITIDNHGPDVTATKNADSSAIDKLVIDVVVDDDTGGGTGVGIFSTCTTDRTGDTVSDTDSTQTITETGLTPSTDYTYTITCADYLGWNGTLTKTFTTDSASVEGAVGGGTTYIPSTGQVGEGYRRDVEELDKVKITIENVEHSIMIGGVTENTATVTIGEEAATLNVGDEKKYELTGDNYYDLYIKLNSITGKKADLTVRAIHEEVPVEEKKEEEAPIVKAAKSLLSSIWFWVIVVVIIAMVAYIVYRKKR